jgi:hypothetical protein
MPNIQTTRKNIKLTDYAVLSFCLIVIISIFQLRDIVYFRDYAITFEGAYRLFLGQIPYRDFGSPVGPASFIIPAILFKILDPNWTVFLLAQQLQNIALLILIYTFLGKIGTRPLIKRISVVIFSLFYLLLLTHPWYNSTGFLLLLAAALCALMKSKTAIFFAGLLSALAILAKQDFGILTILISVFFVALVSLGSDLEKIIPYSLVFKDKTKIKTLVLNIFIFIFPLIVTIVVFIYATDSEQFKYWFNYGQEPHDVRHIRLNDLFGTSFGTLGWVTALISLARNNFRLLVASIFLTAASISRTTSGLGFTHYYFVAFLPIIFDECFRLKIKFKIFLLLIVIYTSSRVMIRPVSDTYHVFESIYLKKSEHFFFNYRLLSQPLVAFPNDIKAFSSHTFAPEETINAIRDLKKIITKQKEKLILNDNLKILNLTELTPIYSELDSTPPKGLPLWFHTKVSLFPKQIENLNGLLSRTEFDIILLQGTHEGMTNTYQHFLKLLKDNKSYRLIKEIKDTPANATWRCAPDCQGQIYIFIKI